MLVGAAIASRLPPPLGLPLSFASHFVLDAIPHYDGLYPYRPYRVLPILQLLLDFLFGAVLLSKLTAGSPDQSYLVIAALTAILPDVQSGLYLNYKVLSFLAPTVDFHIAIQRKPPTWVGMLTTLLVTFWAIWILLS